MEETTQITPVFSHCFILLFNLSQWGWEQYADGVLYVSKGVEDLELFMNVTYYLTLQNRIN